MQKELVCNCKRNFVLAYFLWGLKDIVATLLSFCGLNFDIFDNF